MIRRIFKAIKGFAPPTSNCEVVGCAALGADKTELKALDPIDHEDKTLQLCAKHQTWAHERNEFAEEMHEKLREARKEIGQEHIEQVQQLAHPQDGKLREDILMAEVEGGAPLSQSTEEAHAKLRKMGEEPEKLPWGEKD